MESLAGAVQELGSLRSKSASSSDPLDQVVSRSATSHRQVSPSVLVSPSDYLFPGGIASWTSSENPFDVISTDDHAKHRPLENFILQVNLAKDLFSVLEARKIPQLQSIDIATDLRRLSDVLSQTLAFYKDVKGGLWDARLRDAVWESQKPLINLLQLSPRQQQTDCPSGPDRHQMLRQVTRQMSTPGEATQLQVEVAKHVQAITVQFDRVKTSSVGSLSSRSISDSRKQLPVIISSSVLGGEDNASTTTYTAPSEISMVTGKSSISSQTSDGVSLPARGITFRHLKPWGCSASSSGEVSTTSPSEIDFANRGPLGSDQRRTFLRNDLSGVRNEVINQPSDPCPTSKTREEPSNKQGVSLECESDGNACVVHADQAEGQSVMESSKCQPHLEQPISACTPLNSSPSEFGNDSDSCCSEILDQVSSNCLQGLSVHPDGFVAELRLFSSERQILDHAARAIPDSGAERLQPVDQFCRLAVADMPGDETRPYGLCFCHTKMKLNSEKKLRIADSGHSHAIYSWLECYEDPWTALRSNLAGEGRAAHTSSCDFRAGTTHLHRTAQPNSHEKCLHVSSMISHNLSRAAIDSPRTNGNSLEALLEGLNLDPTFTGIIKAAKTVGHASGAEHSSAPPAGNHRSSRPSANKVEGQKETSDEGGENEENSDSEHENDSLKASSKKEAKYSGVNHKLPCIFRDLNATNECSKTWRNTKRLKVHLKRRHGKSTLDMRISKKGRPNEVTKWQLIRKELRPTEPVLNPYEFIRICDLSNNSMTGAEGLRVTGGDLDGRSPWCPSNATFNWLRPDASTSFLTLGNRMENTICDASNSKSDGSSLPVSHFNSESSQVTDTRSSMSTSSEMDMCSCSQHAAYCVGYFNDGGRNCWTCFGALRKSWEPELTTGIHGCE